MAYDGQHRLGSLPPTERLDLAERGTGTHKSTGEEYTADGTYEGSVGPKQYEVKTARTPGYEVNGITSQINEGLSKFASSPPGSYEVDIFAAYADLAQNVALNGAASRDDTPDPSTGTVKRDIKVGGVVKSTKDRRPQRGVRRPLDMVRPPRGRS